ncbi:hypothetical protein J7K44_02670 [bacterium]|nr:hypothetical protein [bacterium]
MSAALIHGIIVIIIDALALWLGLWVYFANRKAKANQLFLVIALLLILWNTPAYFCQFFTEGGTIALFLARLGYIGAALFLIPLYFFINFFPREEKRNPILDKIVIGAGIFLFLTAWSNQILTKVEFSSVTKSWLPVPGPGIWVPLSIISLLAIYVIFRLLQKYLKSEKEDKLKIQYFLIGFSTYLILNLIFDVIYVLWKKSYDYHFIGEYSAIFLLGLTAVGIVKRKLFGIKVVLTQLLVGLFSIFLLIETVFAKGPLEFLGRGVVFVVFLIFGYFIIKETLKLDKLSEILERKVKERTKELQAAYEDIKKRKEDLEKFYKLTVGRELRMIELKQKIKELEKEIKKEK